MDALRTTPVSCPYCGETIELLVDCSAGAAQYVEDCEVCCRPITVCMQLDDEGNPRVDVRDEDA